MVSEQFPTSEMNPVTKEQSGELGQQLVGQMSEITNARITEQGLANAELNKPFIAEGQSIKALRDQVLGEGDSAIVIAAGPSVKRQNGAPLIKQSGYSGAIIATESAMLYCLRNGIVPDLVVTIDPHSTRIVRWFGDPNLTSEHLEQDDYFSRQDLDESFANQLKANEEILQLVNQYGSQMRIALSSSASPAVVERAQQSGMQIYWWNPMYDDPDEVGSITHALYESNGLPCVNAGGNVGSACWMMADAVLGKSRIGVVGMDFGYYDDVPYENTQYYYEAVDLVGKENLDSVYMRVFNPHLQKWFYTDPAYMWYKNCFLELVQNTDSQTYNCTEGGILFGDDIEFITLEAFLELTS